MYYKVILKMFECNISYNFDVPVYHQSRPMIINRFNKNKQFHAFMFACAVFNPLKPKTQSLWNCESNLNNDRFENTAVHPRRL
jgi:hypothetical protein